MTRTAINMNAEVANDVRSEHGSARKPDEVHAAVPVEVAELARHRRKDSEGEQGAGDDPGDDRNTRVEIGGDRGQAADRTVIVNDEQATPVSATTCTVRGLNRRSSGGARRLTVRP